MKRLLFSLIYVGILIVHLSCRKQWGFGNPRDKAMKYYNKDFVLADSSMLRTDGMYYHINEDEYGKNNVSVYQFYNNGKLRGGSLVNGILRIRANMFNTYEIRGYYKFDLDSLRITEDAHYFKKPKEMVGYFSGDTLYLKYKTNYFRKSDKGFVSYLFIQNGKVLETGIDEKQYE